MNPDGFEVSKEGRCDGGQGRLDIYVNNLYFSISRHVKNPLKILEKITRRQKSYKCTLTAVL